MTYSMMVGKYKLIFSDTHFKDFRKKPTISVYDADTNSETKIASFNSQETFEWFIEAVVEADRKTEPQYDIDKGTIKCDNCSENGSYKCSKCDGEIYFKRLEVDDEPQIDGAIDEARFKAHCMNCQRDVADIKCLDCDGDKYFKADEPQTDCSWK